MKCRVFMTRYVLAGPQPCELVDVKVDLTYKYNTLTRSGSFFRATQSLKLVTIPRQSSLGCFLLFTFKILFLSWCILDLIVLSKLKFCGIGLRPGEVWNCVLKPRDAGPSHNRRKQPTVQKDTWNASSGGFYFCTKCRKFCLPFILSSIFVPQP